MKLNRSSLFALLPLVLLLLTGCSSDTYTTVTVLSTSGTVNIERSANSLEAREGMRLVNLDTLRTAAASSSWLTLDEEKAVQLGEHTELNVDKQTSGFALTLTAGEITASIDRPLEDGEHFTVTVGNLTMGVRGTIFSVKLDDENIATVEVERGVVAVTDADGKEIAVLTEGRSEQFNAEEATLNRPLRRDFPDGSWVELEYDDLGRVLRTAFFSPDGVLRSIDENEYEGDSFRRSSNTRNLTNGGSSFRHEFQYEGDMPFPSSGVAYALSDGAVLFSDEYFYNESNILVTRKVTYPDGSYLVEEMDGSRTGMGRRLSATLYNADGTVLREDTRVPY